MQKICKIYLASCNFNEFKGTDYVIENNGLCLLKM